jgi:hypothetical protein
MAGREEMDCELRELAELAFGGVEVAMSTVYRLAD